MHIFKHEHPANLISRLFMLEYMREIGANDLYAKANKHQKEKFFYKYTDNEDNELVDINYEYCTFIATLHELETFMKLFLIEIEKIEESRAKIYEAAIEEKQERELAMPVDINIMDLAQTEINKNEPDSGLIL